jgi:thiol-disulfide isomerase/thioredoxin
MAVLKDIGLAVLLSTAIGCGKPAAVTEPQEAAEAAPDIDGGLTWINSPELKLAELHGKVVLLDFFEYSCVNCIRTIPYRLEWQKRYGLKGLVTIGIHTPQYGFSMDPSYVYAGVKRLGITYPVVVDSNFKIADAYQNRFWPRLFLVDQRGKLRFQHTGEGAYQETELMIQKLLAEIDPTQKFPEPLPPVRAIDKPGVVCYPITPELYLGRTRGQLGNTEAATTNAVITFHLPSELNEGRIYVSGDWANQSEYMRHVGDKDDLADCLVLKYRAVEVNVVMKPEDIYWQQVFVTQDGKPLRGGSAGEDVKFDEQGRSYVEVRSPRMYNLIANQPYGAYELHLCVQGKGLSVYSFSFGTCEIPQNVDKLRSAKEAS